MNYLVKSLWKSTKRRLWNAFRQIVEISFHGDMSRFYYKRLRFSWWQVEILLWRLEILMHTGWDFNMNGSDFYDARSRFYYDRLRFSWLVEIFVMTDRDFMLTVRDFTMSSRDFYDDRSRFHNFVPGVTQGNEDAGSVQDLIFLLLC